MPAVHERTLIRTLPLEAAGANDEDAPIPCTLATQTPVEREGMLEVLDCSADGVDLSRGDLSLIVGHNSYELAVGVVSNIRATGSKVVGEVRFGTSPEARQLRADVLAGIHRFLSVGYMHIGIVNDNDEGQIIYRWRPVEVSLVSVPADPNAGFFRSLSQGTFLMPAPVQTQNPADSQARAVEIIDLCQRHAVGHMAADLVGRAVSIAEAKDAILTALAVRDAASGGHLNVRPQESRADRSASAEIITNTLAARMGVRVQGPIISSVDCVGLAARSLSLSGVRVDDAWNRSEVIQRAMGMHTTSDFPALLGAAARRVLHEAYEAAPVALKVLARRIDASDFRERSTIRLSAAPSLEKVGEHGEFKYGSASEGAASWKLATYGRIMGLTRQAMVNDDLGGFADLLNSFGDAAARREAEELYAVLTNPPVIDGGPLFSVARSSLISNALDLEGLGAAVLALRKQRGLSGELISQEPAHLVVPAALEMKARQLVASFTAMQAGDVQPFTLKVAVEPRLDAVSAKAWYLVAARQSALEYGYLDGNEGVQISQREGFEVDGIEIKARLDFGCGWGAPLGWVKSSGDAAPL